MQDPDGFPPGWHLWFWLAVFVALSVAAFHEAEAQTPVTLVDCSDPHDTCRWSAVPVQDSEIQVCLDNDGTNDTLAADCGGVYASCWSYGAGDHDFCAVLPNIPATESDPCYAGCQTAEATACGRKVEVGCTTCRSAYAPSTPRCHFCERIAELCFLEAIPTDPADPNYPGEGGYNPDNPSDPTCYGEADCDEDDEPPFTDCDSSSGECACGFEEGALVYEEDVGDCSGDFNGDGDVDTNEMVNKVCDGNGMCSCPAGTVEESAGQGNACRVINECSYYGGYYGESRNCGCGNLFLYEGDCVAGCPQGSTERNGQCVPGDDDTEPDPFSGAIGLEVESVCDLSFELVEGEEEAILEALNIILANSYNPGCERFVTALLRVFSPTFAASSVCPFDFGSLSFSYGGQDYDAYGSASDSGVVCGILESNREAVQNILGWVYILIAAIAMVRYS